MKQVWVKMMSFLRRTDYELTRTLREEAIGMWTRLKNLILYQILLFFRSAAFTRMMKELAEEVITEAEDITAMGVLTVMYTTENVPWNPAPCLQNGFWRKDSLQKVMGIPLRFMMFIQATHLTQVCSNKH